MAPLNATFTDEELASVRAAATSHDVSLRTFAHQSILAAASEHRRGQRGVHRRSPFHRAQSTFGLTKDFEIAMTC